MSINDVVCILVELFVYNMKPPVIRCQTDKTSDLFYIDWYWPISYCGYFVRVCTYAFFGYKNFTLFWKNTHLGGLSFKCACIRRSNTFVSLFIHSSKQLPGTIMSSIYSIHSCHCSPLNTSSSSHSKVLGLLTVPNGITTNW